MRPVGAQGLEEASSQIRACSSVGREVKLEKEAGVRMVMVGCFWDR